MIEQHGRTTYAILWAIVFAETGLVSMHTQAYTHTYTHTHTVRHLACCVYME